MATPLVVDRSTLVNASTANRWPYIGGGKLYVKILYAIIRYTGTAWEVFASHDSCEFVSGNLSWNTDTLSIAISGYTNTPVAIVCPMTATGYTPFQRTGSTNAKIDIGFRDSIWTLQTVQSTGMFFGILVIGA